MEEARRLASLQKQRELKAAGIELATKVRLQAARGKLREGWWLWRRARASTFAPHRELLALGRRSAWQQHRRRWRGQLTAWWWRASPSRSSSFRGVLQEKRKRTIDYSKEVAFERKPAAGFFDTAEEQVLSKEMAQVRCEGRRQLEKYPARLMGKAETRNSLRRRRRRAAPGRTLRNGRCSLSACCAVLAPPPPMQEFRPVTIQELEGKRKDTLEEQLMKRDVKRQKIQEAHNMPAAVAKAAAVNDPVMVRRKGRMMLPAPQVRTTPVSAPVPVFPPPPPAPAAGTPPFLC